MQGALKPLRPYAFAAPGFTEGFGQHRLRLSKVWCGAKIIIAIQTHVEVGRLSDPGMPSELRLDSKSLEEVSGC